MRPFLLIAVILLPLAGARAERESVSTSLSPSQRFELRDGHYLVSFPAGYRQGDRPPLIITLHGTETLAQNMMSVWRATQLTVPCIILSPQNDSAGWLDSDAQLLWEVFRDFGQRFSFDAERVLLTGHSAGGAMAFHMAYDQRFPVSAVATSANYLPPTVTRERIESRADVPVFYAVGRDDLNHQRMRDALVHLRTSGASVTMLTPDIGHVIHHRVLQQAADWFGQVCTEQAMKKLDGVESAFGSGDEAMAVYVTEHVLAQRFYYAEPVIARAESLYRTVTLPGASELHEVMDLIDGGKQDEAAERLARLEMKYAGCQWVERATTLRLQIERGTGTSDLLEQSFRRSEGRRAQDLLIEVHQLLAENRLSDARSRCRLLIDRYAAFPEAREAADLIKKTNWSQ